MWGGGGGGGVGERQGGLVICIYLLTYACFSPTDALTIIAERLSVDPVRFSCVSRGLPSTFVSWAVPGIPDPEIYLLSRSLRDGTTSTYDNILTVDLDLESTTGLYECDITSVESNQTAAQPTTTPCEHITIL